MNSSSPKAQFASSLDDSCINTLRFLSVDAVQHANSGHPGLPLGAASMAYVLWVSGPWSCRRCAISSPVCS